MFNHPALALAFRPFFLSAVVFAVISMLAWLAQLQGWSNHFTISGSATLWHAHEMIYGYALAAIAGFLLTAVRNWTGVQTVQKGHLFGLWLLWVLARVGALFGWPTLSILFDLAFNLALIIAFSHPIIKVKQWKQIGIVSKLVLILVGNSLFALGLSGDLPNGQSWGIGMGLYLSLAMVLVLARRVVPFFISKVAGNQPKNYRWLDIANLVIFTLFAIQMTFFPYHFSSLWLSLVLFALNTVRLVGWYTPVVWKTPMLWVLYLAYAGITSGFLINALVSLNPLATVLATHAFTIGGIGLISAGMMARVSLGHTGRSIYDPPATVAWIFSLLVVAFIARALLPLLFPATTYSLGILIAQVTWIAAFGLLALSYFPIWMTARVDGQPG